MRSKDLPTFKETFLTDSGRLKFNYSQGKSIYIAEYYTRETNRFCLRVIFNAIKTKEIKYIPMSVVAFHDSKYCQFRIKQKTGTIRNIKIKKKEFIKSKVFPDADKLKVMLGE